MPPFLERPKIGAMKRIAFVVFQLLLTVSFAAIGFSILCVGGCAGWGQKSCAVIDLAHQACTTIRYLGEDGKPKEMQLGPSDGSELVRAYAAKRADAGTP
jgi:hypothetical protein